MIQSAETIFLLIMLLLMMQMMTHLRQTIRKVLEIKYR